MAVELEVLVQNDGDGDYFVVWDEVGGGIISSFETEDEARAYIEKVKAGRSSKG